RRWVSRAALVIALAMIGWFAFGWLSAQTACAHDPRFACSARDGQHAIPIRDPGKSWAYYGRLKSGEFDTYALAVRRESPIPVNLLIESADAAAPGRPRAVVRDQSGSVIATVSFDRSQPFYEPFSRISYLATPVRQLRLLPGLYAVAVTMDRAPSPQRYVLAIGSAERFGIGEIPYVLGAIHRIRARGY
ncbi:MAG: hypothetical protein WA814_08885, partial [Candidatus Baltobacteraceae bacterium]